MPSQRSSSISCKESASRLRAKSVSSMRSRKRPPECLASSQLNSAVRALPRCRSPVGLGAKRVIAGKSAMRACYVMALRGWKGLRMAKRIKLLTGLLALSLHAVAAPAAQWVRVTTSMGEFVIELEPQRSPLTVANFLQYVQEGFYSGTLFHRVVSNF